MMDQMNEVMNTVLNDQEERDVFLDLCQFLRDYENAGNDISNVNWNAMDELADQFLVQSAGCDRLAN